MHFQLNVLIPGLVLNMIPSTFKIKLFPSMKFCFKTNSHKGSKEKDDTGKVNPSAKGAKAADSAQQDEQLQFM